jgi:FtsP/CotA-like multicopper oxidase with cupredoxin domain
MQRRVLWVVFVVLSISAALLVPRQWYPLSWQVQWYEWFGPGGYRERPPSDSGPELAAEEYCPDDVFGWRKGQVIDGVEIAPSLNCIADNPYLVAAAVKGTNNVSPTTLMQSGLTPDAVVMGRDLDGDGDPDEVHIRLEVTELNGSSPDRPDPMTQFDIAPGIRPGLWVFTPKSVGMSTENFESVKANPLLRAPSPVIRVEQGDKVFLTLENTHYMPHTIHLHGVDHPFSQDHGMPHDESMSEHEVHGHTAPVGNDGVPETSEVPPMPARSHTYEIQPRHAGTMFYHCHVQSNIHILMGLQGMFVVEENRPNNWVQTLNIAAGQVRHSSVAVREAFDREYDLHFEDIYKGLGEVIQTRIDPRLIIRDAHRQFDITQAKPSYFLLNGRSFPYTMRESLVIVKPDEKVKLRMLNGGNKTVPVHTHGHKLTITHLDGVEVPPAAQVIRDVVTIDSAQRVDVVLNTTNDGLHSYGPGIWLTHDHQEVAQTNAGIGPGGSMTAIVYEDYLDDGGFPKVQGVEWKKFFTPEYYQREVPVWLDYDPLSQLADTTGSSREAVRFLLLGLIGGAWLAVVFILLRRPRRRSAVGG